LNTDLDIKLQKVFSEIDLIASDNRSGASEIIVRASAVFSTLESSFLAIQPLDAETARRLALRTCVALLRAQPEMAPLARLASAVAEQVKASGTGRELIARAAASARDFIELSTKATARAATVAAALLQNGATILTHSRSSTVVAALLEARRAGLRFSVIATESRPGLEGRSLSEELARNGLEVSLVADAAAGLMMTESDMVLFGADRVTPDFVVNKIGTRMIALAAGEKGLPVYALADTTKFINSIVVRAGERDDRSAGEIWTDPPRGVRVVNRYFEPTPLDLFTEIVTEEGILLPRDAGERAESTRLDQVLIGALEHETE
jgi:translation initiation factor eIF-2B subunit delta